MAVRPGRDSGWGGRGRPPPPLLDLGSDMEGFSLPHWALHSACLSVRLRRPPYLHSLLSEYFLCLCLYFSFLLQLLAPPLSL